MHRFLQSDFFYSFRNAPVAVASFFVFAVIILAAVFANFIAPNNPFDPASLNLMNGFTPPLQSNEFTGDVFLLGADDQGRDLFSTILYGLRISLFVGIMAVMLAMVMGVVLGLIAGYLGGWLDTFIMRFADIQMTFPSILVAMLIYGVAKGVLP
ncbi:MAG: ABC transporter permease subunit, partial [Gammaproteobacteria bacterium]